MIIDEVFRTKGRFQSEGVIHIRAHCAFCGWKIQECNILPSKVGFWTKKLNKKKCWECSRQDFGVEEEISGAVI